MMGLTEGRRARPAGDGADAQTRHRNPAGGRRHLDGQRNTHFKDSFWKLKGEEEYYKIKFLPSSVRTWVCSWARSGSSGLEEVGVQCRVWSAGEESGSSASQPPTGTEHTAGHQVKTPNTREDKQHEYKLLLRVNVRTLQMFYKHTELQWFAD